MDSLRRRAAVAAGALLLAATAALGVQASTSRVAVTDADCSVGRETAGLPNLRRERKPLFRLTPVARRLAEPVYVASTAAEPRRIYILEKRGTIRVLERGRLLPGMFLDLRGSVRTRGEEGLLSLAFHPRYAANRLVYVAFDDRQGDVNLVEYRTSGNRVLLDTARLILRVDKLEGVTWHNGGQLQFGPDGKLYFATGDSAHTPLSPGAVPITDPDNHAQDLSTLFGKLLRIDVDATPSVEKVAYGLRNPWRFAFDSATGALYIGDVGFHLREEVNVIPDPTSGLYNFGWSACEGNRAFVDLDAAVADRRPRVLLGSGTVLPPVVQYLHPRGGYCSARGTVIGGYVYRGRKIPRLRGRYVFGDFCTGEIWSVTVAGGSASGFRLEHVSGRLSSFGTDAAGELYATMLGGSVFRLDAPR